MFPNNLLKDPVISVIQEDGARSAVNLPALLAGLSNGQIAGLSRVAAHQRQVIFRFLVQLGAIALSKKGVQYSDQLPYDEGEWRELLRGLTPDFQNDEPWHLVFEDISMPAFMQPAILTKEGLTSYKRRIENPDELDVLNLSKSHDVKSSRAIPDDSELWLYALISLQTTQGYFGVGNQGISRMNGGFASRCFISRTSSLDLPTRFIRDVKMLLFHRDRIAEDHDYPIASGKDLLWLTPWDEDTGLQKNQLDPYFIEICRRIRLVSTPDGYLCALFKNSASPRIDSKEFKGKMGDPWVPIDVRDSALTVSSNGFTTELKCNIFFGGGSIAERPLSLDPVPSADSSTSMIFIGSVLVRGQGITEGLHEFAIPVSEKVRTIFGTSEFDLLGMRASRMLEEATTMRLRVMGPALLALLQGGGDNINFKDNRVDAWRSRFNSHVDNIFFDYLWDYAAATGNERSEQDSIARWVMELYRIGKQTLNQAMDSLPTPVARKLRAEAHAESMFEGSFKNRFGDYLLTVNSEEKVA